MYLNFCASASRTLQGVYSLCYSNPNDLKLSMASNWCGAIDPAHLKACIGHQGGQEQRIELVWHDGVQHDMPPDLRFRFLEEKLLSASA